MDTITVNPERRDPGFIENKFDVGLGRVDNISSTDLLETIIKSAKLVANEKIIGDEIQTTGETFIPLFESAEDSSTCSLSVGFYKENIDSEVASFDITVNYNRDNISYLLNVAPNTDEIEDLYLRLCKKGKKLVGGIYWEDSSVYFSETNFKHIGVNLMSWTEGSNVLDPSYNQISLYNINDINGDCSLLIDIPLNESSSTLDNPASSFALYDSNGNKLVGTDSNYSSSQLSSMDVPTINGVPFLLKRGTLIDGVMDARHIKVPAKHENSHIEGAGAHNWDVLDKIRVAGLKETSSGAVSGIGQINNDDSLNYGVTRLSKYGKLDQVNVTTDSLNDWIKTLGIDTDVISVGLFKNFVGYIEKLIDSTYNPIVYNFSLADSSNSFLYQTSYGSEGVEIIINTYKQVYSNSGYTLVGSFGANQLMEYTVEDVSDIIPSDGITIEQLGDTQLKLTVVISRNSSQDSKTAKIILKQLDGAEETELPDLEINIFQEGYVVEYGYLYGNSEETATPIFNPNSININTDFGATSIVKYISPIISENTELGYKKLEDVTTEVIIDTKAKSWANVKVIDNKTLSIDLSNNDRSSVRTASGYLAIYNDDDENKEILGRLPFTIEQGPVEGYLRITTGNDYNIVKSGDNIPVTVSSNYPWTIDISTVPSWIEVSGFNGSMKPGIKTVNFIITPNDGDNREANIKFINDFGNIDTVKVHQSGKENYVDIVGFPDSDVYLSMAASGNECLGRDTVEITFKTDKTWMIDYKPDWISIDITSGKPEKDGNKIVLTYKSYLNPNKQQGDFVSIGYFDTESNTIISLRKIYIDLRTWGMIRQGQGQSTYIDSGTGAYIFGATNHFLKQGESDYLYCIGDGKLWSNLNETDSAIFRTYVKKSGDSEEFNEEIWEYKQEQELGEIGIKYPKIGQYSNKFRYYRKTITAKDAFEISSLTNIESIASDNSGNSTEYYIDSVSGSNYYLGVPGATFYPGTSNYLFSISRNIFIRLMKFGLKIQAYNGKVEIEDEDRDEIGDENGVTLSGDSNTITLMASKKDINQPFVHLTLMNNSLPGWIYFETDLTEKTSIYNKESFTGNEERYIIHVLPNKTSEPRSITLQITDRNRKDTLINYTITQKPSILSVNQKILVGAVPILSENIVGPESNNSIEVKPLLTWKEKFRIDGSDTIERTYREIPEISSAEIYVDPIDNDWLLIRKENFKYYLEVYQNTTPEIRKRTINVRASDEYGNTITGSLDIYQPSSNGTMPQVTYENLSASVINLGLNSENPVPIEISNIGYKIEGKRKIQCGENTDETNGELFPRYIGELVANSTSKQKFDYDIPLSLVRMNPIGSETQSSISISLGSYNINPSLLIYQQSNEIPFEVEYSYLKISDQVVSINITPINDDIIIDKGNVKNGNNNADSETYLYLPESTIESQKYVIKNETESLVIPGTEDRTYNENYGLSLQKSLASGPIKFSGRNSGKTFYLTLVPELKEPTLTISNPSESESDINTTDFIYAVHGLEIPHYIYVEGLNSAYHVGTNNFGNVLESCTGKNKESRSKIDVLWKNSTDHFDTRSSSYFYAPHIPVSAKVVGLEGYENYSESCGVHIKPNSDTNILNNIFSNFRYSDNIDENIIYNGNQTKIYLERIKGTEENRYIINYSGLPLGISISNVSVKNNISNQTRVTVRGEAGGDSTAFQSEILISRFKIDNDSEIHGTYQEPLENDLASCGDSISFSLHWGNSLSGNNNGQILADSGDEFEIAEITFEFTRFDTYGLKFSSQKTLEIWYKGKDIVSELSLPAKDNNGINRIIVRGDQYVDENQTVQKRLYLYDYGTTSESGSYHLLFKTKKNWMIYMDSSKHSTDLADIDWSFNGVPYSPIFSNVSQNCGYSGDTMTTISPRMSMINPNSFVEVSNKLSPWRYKGTSVYKDKILSLFRIVATNNVTSSTNWGQLSGPEFRINIGPRIPRFSIWDELSQSRISHLGGNLRFFINPRPTIDSESSYIIRAEFSLDDFSYNYDINLIQALFSGGLGFRDSDTPFLCWGGEQDDPVIIETQWARKLSFVPQTGKFYITIESRLKNTAIGTDEIGYYDGKDDYSGGREFGEFSITMKDPASNYMASNSPYTLTFNGISYDWNSSEWDEEFNFDWEIDGEVVLDKYYPTLTPTPQRPIYDDSTNTEEEP